jgi:hypothetical protein
VQLLFLVATVLWVTTAVLAYGWSLHIIVVPSCCVMTYRGDGCSAVAMLQVIVEAQ